VLLGWADRAPIVGKYQQIVTVNGLFRPFALVDGRAAATWSWSARKVVMSRFAELPEHVEAALAAEVRDVQRFLIGQDE
jgi:Winged helix DNA-binding domain